MYVRAELDDNLFNSTVKILLHKFSKNVWKDLSRSEFHHQFYIGLEPN